MDMRELLEFSVAVLDDCVRQLSSSFPQPHRVTRGDGFVYRHAEHTDLLLSYVKAVRISSAHNAAVVLMRNGFVQETYSLCRAIDEACEDHWFMVAPLGENGQASEDQRRFLEEFFQEAFSDPEDLLLSTKRDRLVVYDGLISVADEPTPHRDRSRQVPQRVLWFALMTLDAVLIVSIPQESERSAVNRETAVVTFSAPLFSSQLIFGGSSAE